MAFLGTYCFPRVKVVLKMDHFGNGLEVDQARLGMCKQLGDVFTEEKFRYMCILSGCDYLSSLRGIGLAKACKVLRLANNPDIVKVGGTLAPRRNSQMAGGLQIQSGF